VIAGLINNNILANKITLEMGGLNGSYSAKKLISELGYQVNDKSPYWGGESLRPKEIKINSEIEEAIKQGLIQKKPCKICGSALNIQGRKRIHNAILSTEWFCDKH
jgi:hypothetical protein